jgi:hypothetical protein
MIENMETIEEVRQAANNLDVRYSGNSGINTIKSNIIAALANKTITVTNRVTPDISGVPSFLTEEPKTPQIQDTPKPIIPKKLEVHDLLNMNAAEAKNPALARAIVRAQALRLTRVKVTNLNPADSALQGGIITIQNKYVKVSRYVPYGGDEESEGYHVEQIILNHLLNQKFPMRKLIKGNRTGVKQYRTILVPKFSVQVLPPLTKDELKAMADRQSSGSGN